MKKNEIIHQNLLSLSIGITISHCFHKIYEKKITCYETGHKGINLKS